MIWLLMRWFQITLTNVTSGSGNAYPSGEHEFTPDI
jgi:membrane-bound inhibitor of C-type lysozyme